MQTLERASKGYQALAVTGDATISWTNYSAANDGAVAALKLTGSISAAATLTFPSYQHFMIVWNATGQTVTVKCSGGVGVSIPNGRKTLLFCDATDYYSAAATWTTDNTTLTNAGDLPTYAQVQVLIANAALPATAGTFRNSAADTTAGYGSQKVVAYGLYQGSTANPAANEVLELKPVTYSATGTDTYAITPSPAITAYASGQSFSVLFTNANTGPATLNWGQGPKAITKNGATALAANEIPAGCVKICTYDGTQVQIVPTPAVFVQDDGQTMFYNTVFGL